MLTFTQTFQDFIWMLKKSSFNNIFILTIGNYFQQIVEYIPKIKQI